MTVGREKNCELSSVMFGENGQHTLKDESSEHVTSCFGSLRHQSIPSAGEKDW